MRIKMDSTDWFIGLPLVLLLAGAFTFQSESFFPDPSTSEVVWTKKTWWGLKEDSRQVRWRQNTWWAQSKDGTWYELTGFDMDPPEFQPVR